MLLRSYFWIISVNLFPVRLFFSFCFPNQKTKTLSDRRNTSRHSTGSRLLPRNSLPWSSLTGTGILYAVSPSSQCIPHRQNSNKFGKETKKTTEADWNEVRMSPRRRISSKALKGKDHNFCWVLWKSACFHIIFNNPLQFFWSTGNWKWVLLFILLFLR